VYLWWSLQQIIINTVYPGIKHYIVKCYLIFVLLSDHIPLWDLLVVFFLYQHIKGDVYKTKYKTHFRVKCENNTTDFKISQWVYKRKSQTALAAVPYLKSAASG